MTPAAAGLAIGLVPIVIGVTGHRDLRPDDVDALAAPVRRLLERLRRRYPTTPLVLVTPLAEGADRLAARVALEQGAALVAPLPVSQAEYERDFPGSVADFGSLYEDEHTVRRLELPGLDLGQDLQYALAGAWVARHSQILIALWDGHDSERVGGTAQVVELRRSARYGPGDSVGEQLQRAAPTLTTPQTPVDPPDVGAVLHIVAPRKNQPSPDNPFSARWLAQEPAGAGTDEETLPSSLASTLASIESFNADATRLARRAPDAAERCARELVEDGDAGPPGMLGALQRAFGLADALASHYQRQTYATLRSLYLLALVAVICFEMYAHVFPGTDSRVVLFLVAYIGVLGLADIVYRVASRRGSQTKFQDYRAVAEGLRVQFYWRLAGLADDAADHYLRKQRDELAWIREAVRNWGTVTGTADPGDLRALATGWITRQRDYFTRATQRERAGVRRYRSIAAGVILASLAWAIPAVVRTLLEPQNGPPDWSRLLRLPLLVVSVVLAWRLAFSGTRVLRGRTSSLEARAVVVGALVGGALLLGIRLLASRMHELAVQIPTDSHTWSVVALTLITVSGALIHSFTEKRAFKEHARQYARMAESFARAGDRMTGLLHDGKAERARALAVELGKEALGEHGDWVMLHRERPIKLPKVGV